MSKKDYILIARTIYNARIMLLSNVDKVDNDYYLKEMEEINHTTRTIVVHLCNVLKVDNPNFKRDKFYNAALNANGENN